MKILKQDEYINCDEYIKEVNVLYPLAIAKTNLEKDDINYIKDGHKYFNNKYGKYKEEMIRTYINDLKDYINK